MTPSTLSLAVLLSLAACGGGDPDQDAVDEAPAVTTPAKPCTTSAEACK